MAAYRRSEKESDAIARFLPEFFDEGPARKLLANEQRIFDEVKTFVESKFGRAKYVLGLAIDFCLTAQRMAQLDDRLVSFNESLTKDLLFERYPRIEEDAGRALNTLTLECKGTRFGIRTVDNLVGTLFHTLGRTSYPSSAPYATGQWAKYADELLVPCFRLSSRARRRLCEELFDVALQRLSENRFYATRIERERLFEHLVERYPRGIKGENAGLVFQGIAYGFFRADSPHLSLVSDKVRTGSKRQKRFGDIDGYYGLHLELSIEVKDMDIGVDNVDKELSGFCHEVKSTGIKGIAFVKTISPEARQVLTDSGVVPLPELEILSVVSLWDWQKQDIALHGFMHYLAHIEENPDAVDRFLAFVRDIEPQHDSLVFLKPTEVLDSD